jgi:hypothetical protein
MDAHRARILGPQPGRRLVGYRRDGTPIPDIRGGAGKGRWVITTGSTALVAATAKTAIELTTPSTNTNDWYQLDATFDGVSGTGVPGLCEIITYTTTGTGTAITFAAAHRADSSTQAKAIDPLTTAKVNLGTEGTGSITVVCGWRIHPQSGQLIQFPLGREFGMNKSLIYGVRFTFAAIVDYVCNLWIEE